MFCCSYIYVFEWLSQKDLSLVNGIYFPPASRLFCLACSFGGSHCWVFPSLFEVIHYFNKNSEESLKITGFLMKYFAVCHDYLMSYVFMLKTISALHHAQILKQLHPLLCYCTFSLLIWTVQHYSHGSGYWYTTKYELYIALTWYCKCWMCCWTKGSSHHIELFQDWYHRQYILSFSLFCLPFSLIFVFLCFGTMLSVHVCCVMGWCSDWLCLGRCPSLCPPFRGTNSGFCVQYLG